MAVKCAVTLFIPDMVEGALDYTGDTNIAAGTLTGTNPGFCQIPRWEFEFAIADGARFAARYARELPRNLSNCE